MLKNFPWETFKGIKGVVESSCGESLCLRSKVSQKKGRKRTMIKCSLSYSGDLRLEELKDVN